MLKTIDLLSKSLRSRLRPPHVIYLILHLVLLLIGILLVKENSPTWVGIGSSLIAAAITGWVIFVYVFLSQTTAEKLNLFSEFGLKTAFDGRSIRIRNEYESRLKLASAKIDVMGFGLKSLCEDLASEFPIWAQRATVRILLLDPEFPSIDACFADQRDAEENNVVKSIQNDVKKFVRVSKHAVQNSNGKFQLRLYRCLPSINIFRIDGELFWGPYLVGDQSRNHPTFLVQAGGILFEKFTKHFDNIWNSDQFSRGVPPDWFDAGT